MIPHEASRLHRVGFSLITTPATFLRFQNDASWLVEKFLVEVNLEFPGRMSSRPIQFILFPIFDKEEFPSLSIAAKAAVMLTLNKYIDDSSARSKSLVPEGERQRVSVRATLVSSDNINHFETDSKKHYYVVNFSHFF